MRAPIALPVRGLNSVPVNRAPVARSYATTVRNSLLPTLPWPLTYTRMAPTTTSTAAMPSPTVTSQRRVPVEAIFAAVTQIAPPGRPRHDHVGTIRLIASDIGPRRSAAVDGHPVRPVPCSPERTSAPVAPTLSTDEPNARYVLPAALTPAASACLRDLPATECPDRGVADHRAGELTAVRILLFPSATNSPLGAATIQSPTSVFNRRGRVTVLRQRKDPVDSRPRR